MAEVMYVEPVIRFCAVISAQESTRLRAIERLERDWGTVFHQSPPLPFEAGGYYTDSMGADLKKVLIALESPTDSGELADWKRHTNAIEIEFAPAASAADSAVARPLNLDPGYVTQAKLVLATTKDRDHRIYLRDGIFAEITLNYTAKRWVHHRWSYPDYRTDAVAEFAMVCRNHLRSHLQEGTGFRSR